MYRLGSPLLAIGCSDGWKAAGSKTAGQEVCIRPLRCGTRLGSPAPHAVLEGRVHQCVRRYGRERLRLVPNQCWAGPRRRRRSPWQYIADAFPYKAATDNGKAYPANHEDEFVYVLEPINIVKEFAFKNNEALPGNGDMTKAVASEQTVDNAIRTMKNILLTYKYMTDPTIQATLVTQAQRVADRMSEVEISWRTMQHSRRRSRVSALSGSHLSRVVRSWPQANWSRSSPTGCQR